MAVGWFFLVRVIAPRPESCSPWAGEPQPGRERRGRGRARRRVRCCPRPPWPGTTAVLVMVEGLCQAPFSFFSVLPEYSLPLSRALPTLDV